MEAPDPSETPPRPRSRRVGRRGPQTQAAHYFPWGAVLVLQILMCGIYAPIWLTRTQELFDGLSSYRKLGSTLPVVSVIAAVLYAALAFMRGQSEDAHSLGLLVNVALWVLIEFQVLRARRILLDHLSPIDPTYRISSLATFFFHVIYLQHVLNQLTERELAPSGIGSELAREFE